MRNKQDSNKSASGLATMRYILYLTRYIQVLDILEEDEAIPMEVIASGGVVCSIYCFQMLSFEK
jgi:hypothetical protein